MSESNTTSRITGLRILAVDDEPDILATIADVLDGPWSIAPKATRRRWRSSPAERRRAGRQEATI